MQNSVRNGKTMTYNALADVEGGQLVVLPAHVGVAITDIPKGSFGELETEGVFELPKDNSACEQGQLVHAGPDGIITATVTDDTVPAGIAWHEAVAGDAFVEIKINAGIITATTGAAPAS